MKIPQEPLELMVPTPNLAWLKAIASAQGISEEEYVNRLIVKDMMGNQAESKKEQPEASPDGTLQVVGVSGSVLPPPIRSIKRLPKPKPVAKKPRKKAKKSAKKKADAAPLKTQSAGAAKKPPVKKAEPKKKAVATPKQVAPAKKASRSVTKAVKRPKKT